MKAEKKLERNEVNKTMSVSFLQDSMTQLC